MTALVDADGFPSGCWGEDPKDRFCARPWVDKSEASKGRYLGYGIWDRKAEAWWMISAWPSGGDHYEAIKQLATARTMDAVCRGLNQMNERQELPMFQKGGAR